MKVTLLQENLLKTVQQATRFIAGKPQIPILSGIYLSVKEGKLTYATTDLRVGFQTIEAVKMEEEGEVVVPSKVFSEFIATLTPGAVEIKTDGDILVVSQKKTKVRIPTFPPAEFPPFPEISGEEYEIPMDKFTSAIQSVIYTASLDETRPVLASLLLRIEDGTLICACTDGYRLSVAKDSLEELKGKEVKVLLPAKSMQEVMGLIAHSSAKTVRLSVSRELSQTFLTVGNFIVLLRMVEGEFPPFEKIVPQSFAFETTLDRTEWLSALKTAMVFAKDNSQVVTLEFTDNQCRVVSASASVGEQEGVIESTGKTSELKKIAFNGKFMMDILTRLETDRVEFKMNDELKPGVLLPEGKEYPLSVIMPFKR